MEEIVQIILLIVFGLLGGHALNIMTKPSEYDNETK